MAALARGERLQIMLTDEELAALDDWRFDKRMPSRASAVRELLKRGLAAEGVVVAGRVHSRDFGVLEPAEKRVKALAEAVAGLNDLAECAAEEISGSASRGTRNALYASRATADASMGFPSLAPRRR